ncbi:unnamed protein product [Zymoseptoria tritici ST99CH_1E4]|uniref:Box C/D snoRNA protein 1 n=1 Tax=Zymoseptoria tritici ST99CH_1E4 TaxID=1276532 RepID=A0A2H1GZ14_ZYMTR|nr:unnamed protein product [Zymoseptoria tritici ST99CH_1E4]
MPDEALLSELCTICFTEKPKYRCPRCKTRTCSLPCYKRHQQRASCNGKRDEAVYVKKSELATPAGIDRDYNYLKSVERTIDHASREAQDRGVNGKDASKVFERGLHPESLLQRYLTMNRIAVNRAPRGMSRQKTNQTRSTKRQHVMWTVEWVDAHGDRDIQHNCLESSTVADAHQLMRLEKDTAERKSAAGSSSGRKIKRRKLDALPIETPSAEGTVQDISKVEDVGVSHSTESITDNPLTQANGLDATTTADAEPCTKSDPAAEAHPDSKRYFYLLKTGTTSASKVLIPLHAGDSMTECLKNRTVLEYPTIFVLPDCPDSLPDGFLLDKEYDKIRKGEEIELQDALRSAGSLPEKEIVRSESNTPSQVDAQRILDMLKRDVTR